MGGGILGGRNARPATGTTLAAGADDRPVEHHEHEEHDRDPAGPPVSLSLRKLCGVRLSRSRRCVKGRRRGQQAVRAEQECHHRYDAPDDPHVPEWG
jgi:hypothetical protein